MSTVNACDTHPMGCYLEAGWESSCSLSPSGWSIVGELTPAGISHCCLNHFPPQGQRRKTPRTAGWLCGGREINIGDVASSQEGWFTQSAQVMDCHSKGCCLWVRPKYAQWESQFLFSNIISSYTCVWFISSNSYLFQKTMTECCAVFPAAPCFTFAHIRDCCP